MIIISFLATLVALSNCRPQDSLYSKGITSYGTPISDNALNINIDNQYLPKTNQVESKEVTLPIAPEVRPLNEDYKPVPAILPLDKNVQDKQDYTQVRPDPVVHKHVYVHIAPPEEEEVTKRNPSSIPPLQKHYKIIFIQTPTQKTPYYNLQIPQTEEKTIVYVLVKKPDDLPDVLPTSGSPTITSKPEVYFIRYKTKEEAINTISDAAKDTFGYTEQPFDKVGKPTDIISGGSISDALLGAGDLADIAREPTSTTEVSTDLYTTSFGGY